MVCLRPRAWSPKPCRLARRSLAGRSMEATREINAAGIEGASPRRRCGRAERSPGADVGAVSRVPVQMWKERAQTRCRCGTGTLTAAHRPTPPRHRGGRRRTAADRVRRARPRASDEMGIQAKQGTRALNKASTPQTSDSTPHRSGPTSASFQDTHARPPARPARPAIRAPRRHAATGSAVRGADLPAAIAHGLAVAFAFVGIGRCAQLRTRRKYGSTTRDAAGSAHGVRRGPVHGKRPCVSAWNVCAALRCCSRLCLSLALEVAARPRSRRRRAGIPRSR